MFPSLSRKCFKTGSMPIFSLQVWSSPIQLLPQASAIIKLHINIHIIHATELARTAICIKPHDGWGKRFTGMPLLLGLGCSSSFQHLAT